MKKTIKKIISIVLVTFMMVASLTGCNEKTVDGKVSLNIGIWDKDQEPALQEMIDLYTMENPNVEIKIQNTTWKEYWTKLEASVTGGQAPDIFWLNVLHVEEYQEAGILKDLTADIEASTLDIKNNFPEALVEGYTIDGKNYAIPKDFDTNGLFFNKEIFDKAGVTYPTNDWTFEDMVKAAEDLKATGLETNVYPLVGPRFGQTYTYPTVFANGGYILNDDLTQTGWDKPETIEGFQVWKNLIDIGLSPTAQQMSDTDPDVMFQSGKLAMYIVGSYKVNSFLSDETLAPHLGLVERPSFKGSDADIINGLAYAVSEKTEYPEEATKFALWLGTKEAMDIQGKAGAVIPARNESQQTYVESKPELGLDLSVFLNHLDQTYLLPHCKATSELNDVERKYMVEAWVGNITIEEACKKIKVEADAILDKMNGK